MNSNLVNMYIIASSDFFFVLSEGQHSAVELIWFESWSEGRDCIMYIIASSDFFFVLSEGQQCSRIQIDLLCPLLRGTRL